MDLPTIRSTLPEIEAPPSRSPKSPAWYHPLVSPEHGVYVMLIVAFLTGAALAQAWTWATTLALLCAFLGFQAEHPWMLQLKQRKSWKPRFLVWGSIYAALAGAIAVYLVVQSGGLQSPLLWICGGAIAAFSIDAVAVLQREQKSIWNEFLTFSAVCLSAPLAYAVTTGSLSAEALGLWLLNSLFFSAAIFTVKLRKPDRSTLPLAPMTRSWVYHAIASLVVIALWSIGWLAPLTASAFSVALLKMGLISWQHNWYCTTKIQQVAILETGTALLFLAIAALSVLPVHLAP